MSKQIYLTKLIRCTEPMFKTPGIGIKYWAITEQGDAIMFRCSVSMFNCDVLQCKLQKVSEDTYTLMYKYSDMQRYKKVGRTFQIFPADERQIFEEML